MIWLKTLWCMWVGCRSLPHRGCKSTIYGMPTEVVIYRCERCGRETSAFHSQMHVKIRGTKF